MDSDEDKGITELILNKASELTKKEAKKITLEDILKIPKSSLMEELNPLLKEHLIIRDIRNFPFVKEIKIYENFEESLAPSLYAVVASAVFHNGELRKTGRPYFVHPFRVANNILKITNDSKYSESTLTKLFSAAFLHDTLEDTGITEKGLKKLSKKILPKDKLGIYNIVKELTRTKEERGNNIINFDSVETKSSLRDLVESFKLPKREYYERMLNPETLKTEDGKLALLIKILDGLDSCSEIPVSDSIPEKIYESINRPGTVLNMMLNQDFKKTDESVFMNYFLLPAVGFLKENKDWYYNKGIGLAFGKGEFTLSKKIINTLNINLFDAQAVKSFTPIIWNITSVEDYVKFKSNVLSSKVLEFSKSFKQEGHNKSNDETYFLEEKAYLHPSSAYKIMLNELKSGDKIIFYVNKKLLTDYFNSNTEKLSFNLDIPSVKTEEDGWKRLQWDPMKVEVAYKN